MLLPSPPRSRAQTNLLLCRMGSSIILTGSAHQIMFSKGIPIALRSGLVIYFNCLPGAEQRAVNAWHPDDPHVRSSADQFDFLIGQVLTTLGLPLTRQPGGSDGLQP